jgi:hypothetical protein
MVHNKYPLPMKIVYLFICLLSLCCTTSLLAQDYAAITSTPTTYYSSPSYTAHKPTATKRTEPVVAVRRAQKISAAYHGYAIVVATSDLPLLSDDILFRQFGNLTYDQNPDGTYNYLIITPFQKKKSVKRFCERVIKGKAPKAKIVKYKTGVRKS